MTSGEMKRDLRLLQRHEDSSQSALFLFWFGAIGLSALFGVVAGAAFVFSESETADCYGGEHDDEYGNCFFHVWPLCD